MAVVQVPPAVGTSGQFIDSIVVTSSTNRQIIVIGSPASTSQHAAVDAGSNLQVISASSGVVQVLTTGTYLVTGTMSLSSGIVTLSSAIAISSGTITLSSATSLSSGTVTLSSNPTVITASSGHVGTFPSSGTLYSIYTFNASSSNSLVCITTAAARLYGWNLGNTATSAALAVRTYDSTTATAGSTTNLQVLIPIPGGSAGAGNNLMLPQGVSYASGLTVILAQTFSATSTGTNHSAGDVSGTIYYI